MLVDHFTTQLETFSKGKAWALCEREAPASAAELREYERAHGYTFPPEYVHVATTCGFGQFGFADVFSIRPGDWSIDDQRASTPGLPANFVPISDNGCGDFYGYEVASGKCEPVMVFADHETGYQLTTTEFGDLYEYLDRYGFNAA